MSKEIQEQTKKCKHCQSDIPKKAKVCPNCRKKQGGILKWILIIVIALVIIGAIAGGEEDQPEKAESNNSLNSSVVPSVSDVEETDEPLSVGDTAEYKGVKVTLNSIAESKGSEYNKPADGNVFLLVNFTIENNTDSDLAVSSMLSFDAYQDGYSTNYSLSALLEKTGEQLDGTIAPGKKMQGTIGYEVPVDYSEFEINYQADVWDSTKFNFVYKKQ